MELFGFIPVNPESFNTWALRISMSLTTCIFIFGCIQCVRAFFYMRLTPHDRLNHAKGKGISADDSLSEIAAKILWATAQNEGAEKPSHTAFLHDATRQVAENEVNGKYLDKISMCANLLPPIGLWGTVAGMIVIFLYTGDPGNALSKGAVGTKLWSTFLALIYYVSLEAAHLLLVMQSRKSIDRGLSIQLQ